MHAVSLAPIVRPAAFVFVALLLALLIAWSPETALGGGSTITVNTTEDVLADVSCADGDCSLRAAITIANPGDTIAFNITSGCFTDICGIGPVAELPPITDDNLTINGFTQPNAVANSAGPGQPTNASWKVTLDGGVNCGSGCSGLTIDADEVTIKGLVITRFDAAGIDMRTGSAHTGAIIEGNSIGVNVFGTLDSGSDIGIDIGDGSGHRIGGPDPEDRNLIGGNRSGINIVASGGASSGHIIQGNIIGLNAAGTGLLVTVSGPATQDVGVGITGGDSITIGGDSPAERNIISGHDVVGVFLNGGASGNTISGNYIGTDITGTADLGNDSLGVGLSGAGAGNVVGGDSAGERNVISGNDVGVDFKESAAAVVSGNYIGTDASGSAALENDDSGVKVTESSGILVGGDSPGERNVFGANGIADVWILEAEDDTGGPTSGNTVSGNYIGTDATGTSSLAASGDVSFGVVITAAPGNTIGGTSPGEQNVIGGHVSGGAGVYLFADDNVVVGNSIGVGATGLPIPNHNGVAVAGNGNTVGGTESGTGNLIAFNTTKGVFVLGPAGNSILGNAIHSNTQLGIDNQVIGEPAEGVTENDPNDADSGSNNLQNFPVLTSALAGSLTVEGTLDSIASTSFRIEFFANAACDPSGNGEGQTFVGFEDIVTDGAGDASFTHASAATVQAEDFLTATATNTATGDTSEFSDCIEIEQAPATPTPTATVTPVTTATPTSTTTPIATATPAATPTGTSSDTLVQGDVNCDGEIDEDDVLRIVFFLSEPIEFADVDCPLDIGDDEPISGFEWGDVNCDGEIDGLDALFVLLFAADLDTPEPAVPSCVLVGSTIT